jgi:DNA modification methylase
MSRQTATQLFPETNSRQSRRVVSAQSHANDLGGKDWTRYSISVWNDIRKTAEEAKLGHPAMFPGSLVERLLLCFTKDSEKGVLDPFCGSGATLVTAKKLGKAGVGFEVAKEYFDLALQRLQQTQSRLFVPGDGPEARLFLADAREMQEYISPSSIDICITSPPYWDILSRKRSADSKPIRDYAQGDGDLSKIGDYGKFLDELVVVFHQVNKVLKPGKYCIVVVMDIRKQDKFYPYHSDLAARLSRAGVGMFLDDIIVWDRRQEYNNLRPLGYPTTFRVNKIHEYILIFRKPK